MLDVFSVRKEYGKLRDMVKHDPYIHSPDFLKEAQNEIHWNYNRPPGYLNEMLYNELSGCKELADATDDRMAGIITELCLLDRFYWLKDRGWDISFLENPIDKPKYYVRPGRPGKRVDVYRRNGDERGETVDEFDAAALIEGTWTLVEGKTRNNFNVDGIMRKIKRFNNIVVKRSGKDGPGCILGLAEDHRSKYSLNIGKYKEKGGNVWLLKGLSSDHVTMLASEYRSALEKVRSEQAA
jgi:hypothetical protein